MTGDNVIADRQETELPRSPLAGISPKAHGAWLGAGSGSAVAGIIVGLIQDYWTHAPLPAPAIQGIYVLVAAAVAFAGAYLLPAKTSAQAAASALPVIQWAPATSSSATPPLSMHYGPVTGPPGPDVPPPGTDPR